MSRSIVILAFTFLIFSCSSSTRITGSWTNQSETQRVKNYKSVFIASLSRSIEVRTKLENALVAQIGKSGIKGVKSTDYFAPDFYQKLPSEEALVSRIRKTNVDAILTVSLLKKESESRYVPGTTAYAPFPAYRWYGGFYSYYSYLYPYVYDPGYYVKDKTYFIESNLYDARSEKLVWSAQSETVNPGSIDQFVNDYPRELLKQMKKDGVLIK